MKKKLLFVIPSMDAGGGERSLVNLLSHLDYNQFDVDLFLFRKTGLFMNSVPEQVNILELPRNYQIFTSHLALSLFEFIRNRQFKIAYSRLMFCLRNRTSRNKATLEQYTWKYQSKSFGLLEKSYDVAIGYLEKSSIYYIIDKVQAKKKVGWIHTNYSNSGMDCDFDRPYFEKLDFLVTVSEECAASLHEKFLDFRDKIQVIHNIVCPEVIKELSTGEVTEEFGDDHDFIKIITMARLSHEKGIDMAIGACKFLVLKGHKIRWYVLGEGIERAKLESLVRDNGLVGSFGLIGIKENPYPYLKKADIYVQPSRYEGKSIAIDEAKILNKPIVVTNFSSAKDQIKHGVEGLVVDINPESIAQGIETLINDLRLRNKLASNLSRLQFGTEEEKKKLYNLFA